MTYFTRSGSMYVLRNGRITCTPHDLEDEPVWSFEQTDAGNLKFRTAFGWWLTTPVVTAI